MKRMITLLLILLCCLSCASTKKVKPPKQHGNLTTKLWFAKKTTKPYMTYKKLFYVQPANCNQ
jgi:hypothetical protein